jgi:predicted metalloprotease
MNLRVAALLACCALIAAGCGSSGSSTSTTTTGSSGSELDQMPKAPEPGASQPKLAGTATGDARAYLTEVFHDAQALWQREFAGASRQYADARLTIFTRAVHSTGCGEQADVGPFYCGANHGIYLDLRFFRLMAQRFGVSGFAQAYVVGHEFGHHVQNLLGLQHRKAVADQRDPAGKNARSVRYELQADCLAGVWAHSVYQRGKLTDDDLQQALRKAQVIGSDFQQRMAGHTVDSSLWTHGSSAQRQHWLKTGFETGDPGACDTFTQTTP